MEIIDYLRIIRKRIALLLIIPIVAAALAAAYVLHSPQMYSATATVSTGALVGGTSDFTGPQATNQFVAAFSATALNPAVINEVSKKTGVGPAILRDGLTVAQSGASSDMTVQYQSAKKTSVQTVLNAEVSSTLVAMFQPRFESATKQRDTAQNAVSAANAAVAAYAKKVGIADPPQAYQSTLNQVASLEGQRATMMATGNTVGAQALSVPLKAAQDRLASFGPILQGYSDVAAVQSAAESDFTAAQTAYRQAQSQLESASASNITYISATAATSRVSDLLTLVLPVFAAGFLVAFVVVIGLELLGNAKRTLSRPEEAEDAEEAAEPVARGKRAPKHSPGATAVAAAAPGRPTTVLAGDADVDDEVATDDEVEPEKAGTEVSGASEPAAEGAASAELPVMVPEELEDDDLVELNSIDTLFDDSDAEESDEDAAGEENAPFVASSNGNGNGKGRLRRRARVIR